MTTQDRPRGYGIIDENGANTYGAIELPEEANGFPPDIIVTSPKLNHPLNRHGTWARYFDQVAFTVPALMGLTTQSSRLSGTAFSYDVGAGLTQSANHDANGTYYLVKGRVVTITAETLGDQGATSHLFTATKWTHVYLRSDGAVRFETVNIGVAATPAATEITIGHAVTNATDVTAWTPDTGAAAKLRVPIAFEWHFLDQALVVDKTADGGFGLLQFVQDCDLDNGWRFESSGAAAVRFALVQTVAGAGTTVIDFGSSSSDVSVARGIDCKGLRVVPSAGYKFVKFRTGTPLDATDENMVTVLLRDDQTYTVGAGKVLTILQNADIPPNVLITLDLVVTFVKSGDSTVATYQKWHVAMKDIAGTTSEVDGGASGEHTQNRPGSGGHQATVVAWVGNGLGVVNLTFTAAANGRVVISGQVVFSRYD